MENNKTLEIAAFAGITTLFVTCFFIYFNILQQVANLIMHLTVSNIQH